VRRTAECFLLLAENLSTREHPLLDHEGLQVATDESDQRQVRLFILRSVRARLLGTFLHGGSFRFCTSDSLGGELNRHFYSLIINRLRDIPKKTVATFYPGFFTQKLWVPDVEGNSGGLVEATVTGSDVLDAKVDAGSGRVLVAVRGFIYAEVSTDLLFLIETNDPSSKPSDPKNIRAVYFDGPTHLRPNADKSKSARRSFHDITEVGFGKNGELLVTISDASGGTCQLTYSSEAIPLSCRWSGGESRLCPHGSGT